VETINNIKINWIGLMLKFPLLLHSTPSWKYIGEIDIEREYKRWSTMENEVEYHDKYAITHFKEYNLREICREYKPDHEGRSKHNTNFEFVSFFCTDT
jgi:hypothetical protein